MKRIIYNSELLLSVLKIIFILLILTVTSYNYFMAKFEDIEKEYNQKNIQSIITIVNENLQNLENLIIDYAHWDETYNFVETKSLEYIHKHFRRSANTVQDLGLSFMIFTDLKNKELFSSFAVENALSDDIKQNVLKDFESRDRFATIYTPDKNSENFYLLIKVPISNSDETKPYNGFLYSGKLMTNKSLNSMNKVFSDLKLSQKRAIKHEKYTSKYLKNIKIQTIVKDDYVENIIEFCNYKNKYVLSLETKTNREIIEEGHETLFIYNNVITTFLFVILFQMYRSRIFLNNYNKKLKRGIENKTKELKETNTLLKKISQTDELTQINNRRNFFILAKKALEKSITKDTNLSALMIDIDDFKKINDTYGHDIGDKVLKHFCFTVNEILNEKHIFARLGGEEFVVLFETISNEKAYEITENIRKKIESSFVKTRDLEIKYTISIGFAAKSTHIHIDSLLKEADTLLYKAKDSGKNRIIRSRN